MRYNFPQQILILVEAALFQKKKKMPDTIATYTIKEENSMSNSKTQKKPFSLLLGGNI